MKVLHIINSLATGGAEKLIIDTLPVYHDSDTIDISLALLKGDDYPFYKSFKSSNKQIKVVELSKGSVYNPLLIFKIIPLLRQYAIVHVHLFPALYWVALAKILSGSKTKLIFTEHSTSNRRISNVVFRQFDKFIYKFYSKIICISPQVKCELQKHLGIPESKFVVVDNGVDLAKINEAVPYRKSDFGFSDNDFLLIMVAGFRVEKDHETLLKALQQLPLNFKLILVGDGERREEIIKIIEDLKISDRVNLLGIRMDVYSLLKMADLAVLSSHWEGFGLAAVEAMAAGTPVLVSNVDGLAQVVAEGGKTFPKGNVEELVREIVAISEDESLYSKMINLWKIRAKQFDIMHSIEKTIKTYLCL